MSNEECDNKEKLLVNITRTVVVAARACSPFVSPSKITPLQLLPITSINQHGKIHFAHLLRFTIRPPNASSRSHSNDPAVRMQLSGISIRKASASPSLPTTSNGGSNNKMREARGRKSHRTIYAAVVITSLVWLLLLRFTPVRELPIFCGPDQTPAVPAGVTTGYGLSYISSSQNDGVGSGLVELVDGNEGTRSELVRPKVLAFVGINTGFDSGPRREALRETWFPSTPEGLAK